MTLADLQSRHPAIVERVTPYGTASIRADGWEGRIDELGDHVSLELHGLPWDVLAAILSVLDATRVEARLPEHSREPARNADAE